MNIIFTHCSALIIIGDFKYKMSRSYGSYDADWQRRKSVLIRSLFHDIPILSPVEEESSDSYYVPSQEVFASPPIPYSPLPPLIIEKVAITNKHDEPEEYYSKLYKKIKHIYTKLFTEKRNFRSIDYDSNYNDSSVDDDNENNSENLNSHILESNSPDNDNFDSIIEDREARQSSASTKSKGYGADFESMDTTIIDVVNYTASNEDSTMISEDEESGSENIDGDGIRIEDSDNSRSNGNKECSRERIDDPEFSGGESHHSIINDPEFSGGESHHSIINDHEMTESEESKDPEDEQSYEKECSDSENIDEHEIIEETSQNVKSVTVRIDDTVFRGDEQFNHSSIDDHEKTESEESNEPEDEQSYDKEGSDNKNIDEHEIIEGTSQTGESDRVRIDDPVFSGGEEFHDSSIDDHERTESEESNVTENKQDSYEKALKSKEFEMTVSEDGSEVKESNVEPMEGDVDTSYCSEGPVYRQITTAAMVHFDGSEDAAERESRVYEDSVKSVILPTRFRRVVVSRNVDVDDRIEVLPILEDNADSETIPTFYTDESETTEEESEEVATPQVDAEEEGIIEMRTPQADAPEEDDEAMSTPRLDALEEDDEEMSTPRPESAEDDLEEMESPQPAARDEETKEMEIPLPEAAEEDVEEMGSPHSIEQIRTPRANLSHGSIPITHRSHSNSASEQTAVPQEPTTLTSSTQDGAEHNMSEIQTSNDMNGIWTSIFNESRNKDGTPISGRKRKLVDKSIQTVQTRRVTWEEMRANFFVGTPKIFRLCACTDHICY